MTGSHSRLGISDLESRTTGVIRAYDTGDDNFWLAKRLIQDSARTTVCILTTEFLPLLPAELRGWRPTARSNHCFMIASFRERLGHGRAPVVSRFRDASERLFDFVMAPTLA